MTQKRCDMATSISRQSYRNHLPRAITQTGVLWERKFRARPTLMSLISPQSMNFLLCEFALHSHQFGVSAKMRLKLKFDLDRADLTIASVLPPQRLYRGVRRNPATDTRYLRMGVVRRSSY